MKDFEVATIELLKMFKDESFPSQVALTILHKSHKIPSDKWSLTNRLIMTFVGKTNDARTYRQWNEVGRYVKKGSKAFKIIAPVTKKTVDGTTGTEKVVILGFKAVNVFAVETTDGKPLPEVNYEPSDPPPFLDVAEKLGIKVYWQPYHASALGYYRLSDKSITLCSHDYVVFFHELAHALHDQIEPIANLPDSKTEVVAELTAAILCEMLGVSGYQTQAYSYIKKYTGGMDIKGVLKAVCSVINIVEQIVNKILRTSEKGSTENEKL